MVVHTALNKAVKPAAPQEIEDRLERQRLTFEAIFRLVEKLGTTFDVSKIASLFLMTLMGQLKVRRASLYLVVPENMRLEAYRSLGTAAGAALPNVPVESGFVRWLSDTGGPARLDEFCTDPGQVADEEEEMIRPLVAMGFSHAIALAEQGDLLGALFLSGSVTGETFGSFDEEIIKMLARVASITIKSAFLYQTAVASKLELEEFSEVKREFITHTSHELRTPLTVLKSTLWSLEPEKVEEGVLVDMAKDAIARLESKVEYLLSLNDIELNKTEYKLMQAEVSSIVDNVLREILPELEEKQVHVDVDDQARFRKVLIDSGKIAIVVRSVLDNAVNFVGRGGNIKISIRISESSPGAEEGVAIGDWRASGTGIIPGVARRPSAVEGASYIVISVKDDGIGIPPSEIATLAEPFTMASNSSNRNVKGLGIGLSVSQKVVSGHGGTIFCKSDLGQGAQFSIWLPIDA
ncbi:MAG: ATP-binding protein [Candidatus Krumholzibacteria bacterium]|nr:ATP-binding protein [Candidatus Krumholzibacteria bacterium]